MKAGVVDNGGLLFGAELLRADAAQLQEIVLANERSFRFFEKEFPRGATVKLGPNGMNPATPKKSGDAPWIYLTIVKPGR